MADYDAVIVGAGPAGCSAAITLARAHHRVLLIEKKGVATHLPDTGSSETLAPAAMPLFNTLVQVGKNYDQQADDDPLPCAFSAPSNGNISAWGQAQPDRQDFFFTPAGAGLTVNRCGLDQALRQSAATAGADVLTGTTVLNCHAVNSRDKRAFSASTLPRWKLTINTAASARSIDCHYLIDATGRHACVARILGLPRQREDALFAYTLKFKSNTALKPAGYTRIESCAFGWWYCNTLPVSDTENICCVSLHTDRQLPQARIASTRDGFLSLVNHAPMISDVLATGNFLPYGRIKGAAAGNEQTANTAPSGFLLTGDSAQAFDPLSSQGIHQALQAGSQAGQLISYSLAGARHTVAESHNEHPSTVRSSVQQFTPHHIQRYQQALAQRWAQYCHEYQYYYDIESRWRDQPFWSRRQTQSSHHSHQPAEEAS